MYLFFRKYQQELYDTMDMAQIIIQKVQVFDSRALQKTCTEPMP